MSLKRRVALVTGGGRNIGRAVVLELAERGCDLVVNTRGQRCCFISGQMIAVNGGAQT